MGRIKKLLKQILDRLEEISQSNQEHFVVFSIDDDGKIIDMCIVYKGNDERVADNCMMREIYRSPIVNGIKKIVFAHNHANTDNVNPSDADKDLQWYLYRSGNLFDFEILDHIIVSKNMYYSFADNRILKGRKMNEQKKQML